ncbi:MAG: HAMP domain-containing sensor histidine kinase [Blastocatellia bacterium]
MKLRLSLFARIMLWFFLNLAVIGGVLFALFNLQFRLEPDSPLLAGSAVRIENIARAITDDIRDKSPEERKIIVQRYSEAYRLDFSIYANTGEKLAGKESALPTEVLYRIKVRPPGQGVPPEEASRGQGPPGDRSPPRPRPFPVSTMKTSNPTRYWAVVRIPVYEPGKPEPVRASLAASSDSITGNGLFFDPKPWLVIAAVVFGLSILLWLPFVRGLTKTIRQITSAAEKIAEENFEVRVDEHRSDELGRLGKAINHLSGRLAGFVTGQKRFLGDISHELNSPLARMHFALSILEERTDQAGQKYIADVQEEVQLMAKLVAELLAYARAGLKTSAVRLSAVRLLPLIEQVVAREATGFTIKIEVNETLEALVQPELLSRALANVIRNAVRYAAAAGPITISAVQNEDRMRLTVVDCGAGVPEEEISKLFDPFYRPETDRARTTGGAGLGLAIVKTCVEACQGSVSARNLKPAGFEVAIALAGGENAD